MAAAAFISGDWGTTHLRLVLCDSQGAALEIAEGPGAAAVSGAFADTFLALTALWRRQHGELPAVLCGMVGSSFGWIKVPYVHCPARGEDIARALARVDKHDAVIAPGLLCKNRFGAPDVLRGEETQILGAIRAEPRLRHGRHLICLPGTHTKWVVLEDSIVRDFLTAPTGELYAIIRQHSVLIGATETSRAQGSAFARAVRHCMRQSCVDVLHLLFECRSRQLLGDLSPMDASDYLSGLLIARDVAGAMNLYGHMVSPDFPVTLIGTESLTSLYATALRMLDIESFVLDGAAASRLGCAQLLSFLQGKPCDHAA